MVPWRLSVRQLWGRPFDVTWVKLKVKYIFSERWFLSFPITPMPVQVFLTPVIWESGSLPAQDGSALIQDVLALFLCNGRKWRSVVHLYLYRCLSWGEDATFLKDKKTNNNKKNPKKHLHIDTTQPNTWMCFNKNNSKHGGEKTEMQQSASGGRDSHILTTDVTHRSGLYHCLCCGWRCSNLYNLHGCKGLKWTGKAFWRARLLCPPKRSQTCNKSDSQSLLCSSLWTSDWTMLTAFLISQ